MSKFLVQLREELQRGRHLYECVCECSLLRVWVFATLCVCCKLLMELNSETDKRCSIGLSRTIHNGPLLVYPPAYLLRGQCSLFLSLSLSRWLVLIADRPDRVGEWECALKRDPEWEKEREAREIYRESCFRSIANLMQTLTYWKLPTSITYHVKLVLSVMEYPVRGWTPIANWLSAFLLYG